MFQAYKKKMIQLQNKYLFLSFFLLNFKRLQNLVSNNIILINNPDLIDLHKLTSIIKDKPSCSDLKNKKNISKSIEYKSTDWATIKDLNVEFTNNNQHASCIDLNRYKSSLFYQIFVVLFCILN